MLEAMLLAALFPEPKAWVCKRCGGCSKRCCLQLAVYERHRICSSRVQSCVRAIGSVTEGVEQQLESSMPKRASCASNTQHMGGASASASITPWIVLLCASANGRASQIQEVKSQSKVEATTGRSTTVRGVLIRALRVVRLNKGYGKTLTP